MRQKLVEMEPKDGKTGWLVIPVSYGKEDEIRPMGEGAGSELKQDERVSKLATKASRSQRGRLVAHDPKLSQNSQFLTKFLASRRQGMSPHTMIYYQRCLKPFLANYPLTAEGINAFLGNLKCGNGKHAYFRAIRAFCNWAVRYGYLKENPLTKIDPPKRTNPILPSLTSDQVQYLVEKANNLRDKCIVSLFADSGLRLAELASIKSQTQIDWTACTVTIWGKGNKERRAPFSLKTGNLLREWLAQNGNSNGNIWGLDRRGIQHMLNRMKKDTGFPCNPHTFRRTFASLLHRQGLDIEHIMRLGGWESLDMVVRYTRSVKFEDSLKLYKSIVG